MTCRAGRRASTPRRTASKRSSSTARASSPAATSRATRPGHCWRRAEIPRRHPSPAERLPLRPPPPTGAGRLHRPRPTTAPDPVVILGLLTSMAVVVAATETLLGSWDTLSNDGDTARLMLERVAAHARVVSDALELAAREVPPTMIEATQKPA